MEIFPKTKLAGLSMIAAEATRIGQKVYRTGKELEQRIDELLHPYEEDVITMKKTTFAAILVLLAAVAGALAALYLYLRRREAELDEYEQLLFSEDFSHEETEDAAVLAEEAALDADAAPEAELDGAEVSEAAE